MDPAAHLDQFLWTVIYTLLGLVTFAVAFWLTTKVTPFSIRHEIEEDHNTALAVILGSMILGLSIIIGAAIAG